ncbi:hypothetical protein CRUP_002146 [Coryphaenoides rupestris]|nr:hypothetical protein CRUP_002146 [Coryphaenoides rupestris]
MFSPNSFSECLQEWEVIEKDYQQVQETHRLYKQKLEEVTKLQDSCTTAISRQRKKLKELAVSLKQCKTNQQTQDLSAEEMSAIKDMQDSIKERPDIFFDMEAFLPKKNGFDILLTVLCILVTL